MLGFEEEFNGRIFAYCRVSTDDSGQSTENQEMHLKKHYNIYKTFSDYISGAVDPFKRPQWVEMMKEVKAGDMVVVTAICRIGRDIIYNIQTIQELTKRGIHVKVMAFGNLDLKGDIGQLILGIMSSVVALERRRLSDSTKIGMARAKAKGKQIGREKFKIPKHILEEYLENKRNGIGSIIASAAKAGCSDKTFLKYVHEYQKQKEYEMLYPKKSEAMQEVFEKATVMSTADYVNKDKSNQQIPTLTSDTDYNADEKVVFL